MGATLFERRGRAIRLTNAGKSLLPHAEAALAAVADGHRAVQENIAAVEARLTLAVVGTIADSYLVDSLRRFLSENRPVHVDLQTANSREVSDLVRGGEAVVGLRCFADEDDRLESIRLGAERLYVVVPANHRVGAKRRKGLSAFAEDQWLSFPTNQNALKSYGSLLESLLVAGGVVDPKITTSR